MPIHRKTLTIYQASAGSGKTYNLAKEFILLLFLNHYAPFSDLAEREVKSRTDGSSNFGFQSILGVTFTKKATLELKQRIIRELIRLSEVKPGEEITGISKDVIKELSGLVGKTEQELSGELPHLSEVAVKQILEDYSHFNVRTIDSFFQEVLRALRHEITGQSVSGSYQIELDVKEAVNMAMDNVKLEMGASNYSGISDLVLRLLKESIGREEGSNPFQEIAAIATEMVQSDQWEQMRSLLEDNPVAANQVQIDKVIHDTEEELAKIVEIGQQLRGYELSGWKGKIDMMQSPKAIVAGFVNGELTSEKVSTWELTNKQSDLADSVYPLTSQVSELLDEDKMKTYISARLLSDHLPYLSVLTEMVRAVEEYERQNHLLLIPKVSRILHQIIDGGDTPFIYDRVGTRLHHFLIDEFQDTSYLQWDNFRPLISESRANGWENVIVGDAKQSIYGFRGAESSNFINLVQESKSVPRNPTAQVINLPHNYRSDERIVLFNKTFYTDIYNYSECPNELHAELYDINNVEQTVPKDKNGSGKGYVEIAALPTKRGQYIDKQAVDQYLHRCIDDLLDRGYGPGDIAILLRNNNQCADVAEWLSSWSSEEDSGGRRYPFVSNEALSLDSSMVVKLLSTLLRTLSAPSPQREKLLKQFLISYTRSTDPSENETKATAIYNQLMSLPAAGLSVYDLILKAIDTLGELPEEELIYVNAFVDLAYSYSRRSRDLTIRQFSVWLDQRLQSKTIEMGNGAKDRIRILTVHQSKGLEFPAVILPMATWPLFPQSRRRKTLKLIHKKGNLCPSDPIPDGVYLIDVNNSKEGLESTLKPYYTLVREASYMEELNLLYVAFTRAKSELYVGIQPPSSKLSIVSDIIYPRMEEMAKGSNGIVREEEKDSEIILWHSDTERPKKTQEEAETADSPEPVTLSHLGSLSPQSDLTIPERYTDEKTDFGILIHRLMASVYSKDDVEPLLDKLHQSGKISSEDYQTLLQNFSTAMEDPTYASWFPSRGEAVVRTEATLFDSKSNKEQRPDRVVIWSDSDGKRHGVIIDYKLGEDPSSIPDAYSRQVRRYVDQLRKSGVDEVTGYLWYLRSPNGIIKVC